MINITRIKMNNANPNSTVNFGLVILISCVATIGGFLFGFDSGVINGTVDGLQQAFNSDSIGTGFNVASMLLGCAAGAFFAGRLADIFGRRSLLLVSSVLFLISAWGSGAAINSGEFIFYRILGGLAVGAASVMAPAYISEIAPAAYRGRLTTIQQIAIISGLFVAFISTFLLADIAGSSTAEFWLGYQTWRWMFWIEILPAAIFFVALLFIPESPRYLVASGNKDRALIVMSRLYGATSAQHKVDEIFDSLADDHHRPTFSDLRDGNTGRVRRIIWIGIATCLVTIALVDKVGRKPILWVGSLGMALTLGLIAFAFSTATQVDGQFTLSDNMGVLALLAANAYVMIFNGSWGPVMWVMLGEIFLNQIRGSGLAIARLSQWNVNVLITMSFPFMLASIGLFGAHGIYAFFTRLSAIFVSKMVHETRGLELEEMTG
jgi:SP family sugar:H+ symporter-like MFS transporter